jgi:hypothetical protein
MREFIEKLNDRGEFYLVTIVCFSYAITASAIILLLRVRHVEMTTGRVLRGLVIELVILSTLAAILHLRGWRRADLGLRFSWPAALAGVPLFIVYIVLYYAVAIAIMQYLQFEPFTFVPRAPVVLVVLFILVNSAFEEITVTGYVIEALSHHGAALAITASTLIRFSYHLYQGPVSSISILPLGLLFGAVYWRWRTLWPLMVAHTIANLLTLAVAAARA